MTPESLAYAKHKNLKLAAHEVGITWQSLYLALKRQGIPVTGDKLRYGSDRDRLGALAESMFQKLVPKSINANNEKWQSKVDFLVGGWPVDVKSSKPRQLNKKYSAKSWSFSFKKQSLICSFICCFCLDSESNISHILLVPSEFFSGLQTVSVSCNGQSKWLDYEVDPLDLAPFFDALGQKI